MPIYIVRAGWNDIGNCSWAAEQNRGVKEWLDGWVDGWIWISLRLLWLFEHLWCQYWPLWPIWRLFRHKSQRKNGALVVSQYESNNMFPVSHKYFDVWPKQKDQVCHQNEKFGQKLMTTFPNEIQKISVFPNKTWKISVFSAGCRHFWIFLLNLD